MKKWDLNKETKTTQFFAALVTAFIGGAFFSLIQFPIPWLLGPMTALLIATRFKRIQFYWPVSMMNTGLMIVGYSIGITYTKDSLFNMITHLPSMLIFTTFIFLVCVGIAFLLSRISDIDFPTALTSSIPGGMAQIVAFAEEDNGMNITIVTFFHVTRILMIVFFVPIIIYRPIFSAEKTIDRFNMTTPQWSHLFPMIIPFAIICVIASLIGKKVNLPAPYFLGPIIFIAILQISGLHGPELPPSILDVSQFMIGGYIGLLLKPEQLENKKKSVSFAVASGFILICTTILFSFILTYYFHISPITSFLSLAPGGMDQMGIIAHEVNADVSTVTGYQLFRITYIYFFIPPLLRLVLKWSIRKKERNPVNLHTK